MLFRSALAAAIVFDAFIVRMALIPALLFLLGEKAWWLPAWLDRLLPEVDVEGEKLQRVPRGFPKNHPAAEYLRHRQFLAGREFPAAFAYSPRFYRGLLDTFRVVAPLITFLNEPLLAAAPARLF